MPFPLNQITNLFCTLLVCGSRTGPSAAYAVPVGVEHRYERRDADDHRDVSGGESA